MKRVFIVHGWEGSPSINWFPWLTSELERREIEVVVPQMPDTMNPTQAAWVEHLASLVGITTEETYFVGHSLGGITILRYIESLNEGTKVGGILLTASFPESIGYKELESFFQTPLDYEKISRITNRIISIQSDNDPFVPTIMGELLRDNLSAKLIIIKDGGHFNTSSGYLEFPEVLSEIESMIG